MPGTYNNIAGAEPSTVTFRVGTVTISRGSTAEHQEILVLGDPISSLAQARVLAAAPASTDWGVVVRQEGYVAPSTTVAVSTGSMRVHQSTAADLLATVSPAAGSTWAVRPLQSSQADLRATVYQSTAADLNVTVAGYSTVVNVSTGSVRVHQSTAADLNVTVAGYSTVVSVSTGSVRVHQSSAADLNVTVAGYSTVVSVSTGSVRVHQSTAADLQATVTPVAGSTWAVRPLQSSAADLQVTATQNSTAWSVLARVTTSSGGGIEGSTASPAAGVIGLHTREALSSLQSTTILCLIQTAGGSTTIISSAAGLSYKVYAYSITSTVTAMSSVAFLSSAAIERWGLILGSGSSGITGANLAIPPIGGAFLFRTDQANALQFSASSTGLYRVSVSWITEP